MENMDDVTMQAETMIHFGASATASQAKMAGAQNNRIVRLGPNLGKNWFGSF